MGEGRLKIYLPLIIDIPHSFSFNIILSIIKYYSLYYYNVYVHGSKSLLSKNAQNLSFLQFFLENIWRLWIFCIPLHSLSNKRKQPNNVGYEA